MLSRAKILALVSAFLLVGCATGATAASAAEFHMEGPDAGTVTGEIVEKTGLSFVTNSLGTAGVCVKGKFEGTMAVKTESSLTLAAKSLECMFPVEMRGCDFVLGASGSFAIGGANCAAEPIKIQQPGCVTTIGPQEKASGLIYANAGSGSERDVEATFEVSGLHYIQAGGFCKNPFGTSTQINGKINGAVTLRAEDAEGKQKGFLVE